MAFLVAYVALEWISFIHEYKGLPVTPWNPGLGVVFALMLYSGARYGIVLFVGVLIAEIAVLRTNLPWPFIIGVATIIATGYGAVAFVVRRKLDVGLNHLRDVLLLLAAGAVGRAAGRGVSVAAADRGRETQSSPTCSWRRDRCWSATRSASR